VDQTASKASLQSRRRLGARQGLRSSSLEKKAILRHLWQASPERHAKRDAGSPSPSEPSHTHLWARWSRRSSLLEEPRPSQTIQAGNSLPGTRQRAAYGAPSHTPTVPIRRQRSCLSCGSWFKNNLAFRFAHFAYRLPLTAYRLPPGAHRLWAGQYRNEYQKIPIHSCNTAVLFSRAITEGMKVCQPQYNGP